MRPPSVPLPLKLVVLCLAVLTAGPALAQQPAPMTVAQAIESEIQAAFNKPDAATVNAKNAFMARLSGAYGTVNIYVASYQLVDGVLPPFQNQVYENNVQSYAYTLYQAMIQQYAANQALLRSNPALFRLTLFNYAVNHISNWIAANPPPGVQWVFVEDVGSLARLAVMVNSTTFYPSNWVLSLQTMLNGNGRWASLIIWDISMYLLSFPNEALFVDTFEGL
ncbi:MULTISPECIES: hypothetical protein [unclassified Corallococcus]|uniref:hypothetical protein n=1 Tax=unclassified Corallococcus TaxID=2685029 RepID=UPI001A8C058F|nr:MULTISPECIES: hypothetical protein [unclassified Corallococcus]MBN9683134.1 hypothetical protein [Corallococcus sp. NCSPR001]WAS85337.1 hypothetical protein O0N60_39580 [Corallococcus sp. NCRR]